MPTLSTDQHSACSRLLLRCKEFQSHQRLMAVFAVAELQAYRATLPEASSVDERVSFVIDALMEETDADNRWVLGLLLAALAARNAGTPIGEELAQLKLAIESPQKEPVVLPYVIVAMTRDELAQLPAPVVAMMGSLAPGAHTHPEAYGPTRESWRPFPGESAQSISEIFLETIDVVNLFGTGNRHLRPESFTSRFFAADVQTRAEAHSNLDESGCVLVIDPLSLFHPTLIEVLEKSALIPVKDRVAVLVLAPPVLSSLEIYQKVRSELYHQVPRVRTRDDSFRDHFFEFGVSDLQALRRRLFSMLPAAAAVVQKDFAHPEQLSRFGQQMQRDLKGYERMFPGGRPQR